jgi:CheY-like chemotaxis protein
MDMRMPVMDGYEATRIIKSTTKGQATAIIALTASALEDQKAVILSMGCDGFVRKPFREMDIITVMEQHIGAQFIYADQLLPDAVTANHETLLLSGEVLRSLPQPWLVAFQQAVRNVDLDQVKTLVTTMQTEHPALAIVLQTHIDNFHYEPVLKAIEQALSM